MSDSQFLKRTGQNLKFKTSTNFRFKVMYVGLNLSKLFNNVSKHTSFVVAVVAIVVIVVAIVVLFAWT